MLLTREETEKRMIGEQRLSVLVEFHNSNDVFLTLGLESNLNNIRNEIRPHFRTTHTARFKCVALPWKQRSIVMNRQKCLSRLFMILQYLCRIKYQYKQTKVSESHKN